jgi:hypothetical protein
VIGVDPKVISTAMEWPFVASTRPSLPAAPACWPAEKRTAEGRQQAGVWDFERGLFRLASEVPEGKVRLERLVRDDDRDLYRLSAPDGTFLTTSRTVAILEAHRRSQRPLFRWSAGAFGRLAQNGYLPLLVARALRRRALAQVGPVVSSGGASTYTYPADRVSAAWVTSAFGAAVDGAAAEKLPSRLEALVTRRRRGLPNSWWMSPTDNGR